MEIGAAQIHFLHFIIAVGIEEVRKNERESRRMNSNRVLFEVAQNIRIYLRLNKLGNEKIMIDSVRSDNKLLNGVSF